MKQDMIWAYMLMLSDHMWEDASSPARGLYLPPQYTEDIIFDQSAWDKTVDFIAARKYNMVLIDVGDGIKYESHPEISAPNAWDKDFAKKKLAELRAKGLEPIPKLNFSTAHDTWMKGYSRAISTPEYYAFCADVIREVCELFDYPRLFHIGMDEERSDMQKSYEMLFVRGRHLWWNDLYFLCGECEKHGARPWVWSDYMWHNEGFFLEKMPKSVLQSNWFYGWVRSYPQSSIQHKMLHAYEVLEKHGFDQIPTCSTWENNHNSPGTVGTCRDWIAPERLLGFMTASWETTTERMLYELYNDAEQLYLARKTFYPETL